MRNTDGERMRENGLTVTKGTGLTVEAPEISADLYGRFVAYLDVAPKTTETYTKALRQLAGYLSSNGIRRPEREDLLAFRDDLKASGHKPATISAYMTAARLFFSWTEQEGIYPNIAQRLKGAKLDKGHKRDYLTAGQVREILGSIDRDSLHGLRDYAILALMVTGALRTIEVSRANIGDLRAAGDNVVLWIQGKGRGEKNEYVKIKPPTEKALRAYLKERGDAAEDLPLFTSLSNNSKGGRLSTRAISGIIKERFRAAGYNSERLTAHSLRHTAVTLALLQGIPLEEVQQFARHANLQTTLIYSHALEAARNRCAEVITESIFT